MKGRLGLGLVALGIFVGVMGGYLLNADTVTTCSTEWEYVTDIAGAFQGDRSDLDEGFDTPANATGWSYMDSFNNGRISGVEWEPGGTSVYAVTVGEVRTSDGTIVAQALSHSGTSTPDATLTESGGGKTLSGSLMPSGWGLNSEAVTLYVHDGVQEPGAFAVPVSEVAWCVTGNDDMDLVTFSAPSVSGYPAFAYIPETSTATIVWAGATTVAFYAVAEASDSDAVYRTVEQTVEIAGETYPASKVFLVWGKSQRNGTGPFADSVSVSYVGRMAGQVEYMDAAQGVVPTVGTYTTSELAFTYHPGSASPTMSMSFSNRNANGDAVSECACQGTVAIAFPGSPETVQVLTYGFASGANDQASLFLAVAGGSEQTFSASDGRGSLEMSMSGGTMSFTANGQSAGSYSVAFPSGASALSAIVVETDATSASPSRTVSVIADDGQGHSVEYAAKGYPAQEWTAPLDYSTYTTVTTTHSFDRAYWRNSAFYDAASMRMAFRPSDPGAICMDEIVFHGTSGTDTVNVLYDPSAGWRVSGTDIGTWPAIELEVGGGKAYARPIRAFASFFDYSLMGTQVEVPVSALGDGAIASMEAVPASGTGYAGLRMAVLATTVRLPGGGQYLQDAELSLARSFPDSKAVSVMLGSAARMGTSITFASASSQASATLPVDPDGIRVLVGGAWHPFNGVTFRWVSDSMPAETIDGTVYSPAIYHRGQSYAAGTIWAETKNGRMTKVVDAGDDWTMTLDGVWAPALFMYDGHNIASSGTELADWSHPRFQWSANDMILIMMGVSIIGGLVGSYFRLTDIWDWMAIIGTVGALWLFLG